MQVQRTLKRREGVWGIVKGDKGGASQVAPLSPLTKKPSMESKRCFANAQHDKWNLWRCSFNRTQTRIAHQVRLKSHLQFCHFCYCGILPPPLRRGQGVGHCERAQRASAATNRQGILMILALYTVDCFGYRLAMTQNSACKKYSLSC